MKSRSTIILKEFGIRTSLEKMCDYNFTCANCFYVVAEILYSGDYAWGN